MRFTEIEHKFVLDETFDLAAFRRALARLAPSRVTSLQVRDRYFLGTLGEGVWVFEGKVRRYENRAHVTAGAPTGGTQ